MIDKFKQNESFDTTEHKKVLEELLKIMDGCWIVGIDSKTGKAFAVGRANNQAVADAIFLLAPKFGEWINSNN